MEPKTSQLTESESIKQDWEAFRTQYYETFRTEISRKGYQRVDASGSEQDHTGELFLGAVKITISHGTRKLYEKVSNRLKQGSHFLNRMNKYKRTI